MAEVKSTSWSDQQSFAEGCDVNIGLIRIAELLERMDAYLEKIPCLDPAGAADLRLVCDEIGSNVVRHSSPLRPTLFTVDIEVDKSAVRMRITDNGSEFNPFAQVTPYLGADLDKRRIGGLGLYFIGKLFPRGRYLRLGDMNVTEVECSLEK